ncbi:MAG: hypothetical protein SFU98_04150 [Leptospiraceae bacterium]|nr:hypothetical protein [Leptospiraceae bacterium]
MKENPFFLRVNFLENRSIYYKNIISKTIFFLLIFIEIFFSTGCSKDVKLNLLEQILIYSVSRAKQTSTSYSTPTIPSLTYSSPDYKVIENKSFTLNIKKENLSKDISVKVYLSSNSVLSTSSDTLVQEITVKKDDSTTSTFTINVPLILSTNDPNSYYLFLSSDDANIKLEDNNKYKIFVFPKDSVIVPYTFNSGSLTNQTLSLSSPIRYFEFTPATSSNIIASAYALLNSMTNISISLYRFGYSSLTANLNTPPAGARYESLIHTSSSESQVHWVRVNLLTSDSPTFSFNVSNRDVALNYSGSCSGGANTHVGALTHADICIDYETNYLSVPTNNAGCVSIQGTGSTFSSSSCTSVSRQTYCICLPSNNEGLRKVNYYSPTYTSTIDTININSLCRGDRCFKF